MPFVSPAKLAFINVTFLHFTFFQRCATLKSTVSIHDFYTLKIKLLLVVFVHVGHSLRSAWADHGRTPI